MDFDDDGDLDLVVGTRSDGVFVFENVGSRQDPSYAAEGKPFLTPDGEKVMGSNAHHVDWDGDGRIDLVTGSEGGQITYYRNLGEDDRPRYGDAVILVPRQEWEERSELQGPSRSGSRAKLCVTDWDGDGRKDLLVGDVQWLNQVTEPLTAEEEAAKAELQPAYDAAEEALTQAFQQSDGSAEAQERIEAAMKAYDAASERMEPYRREESQVHGWVWLYRQLPGEAAPVEAGAKADSAAQGPVQLRATARELPGRPGHWRTTATVTLKDGYHIYAKVPEGSDYPVTTPALPASAEVELVEDWVCRSESVYGVGKPEERWFLQEVRFECLVRADAEAIGKLEPEVHLQVCDLKTCLPPRTLRAKIVGNG